MPPEQKEHSVARDRVTKFLTQHGFRYKRTSDRRIFHAKMDHEPVAVPRRERIGLEEVRALLRQAKFTHEDIEHFIGANKGY